MSKIGDALGSAVFNLDFLPERLLLGNPTDNNITNSLSIVTSGIQLMSLTDPNRISALSAYDMGGIGDTRYLKLASGRINKQTTINISNSPQSPQDSEVFASSTNIGNVARRAVEQSINPSANATFDNFEVLIFDPSILRCQLTFENGFTDEFTVPELRALFSTTFVNGPDFNTNIIVAAETNLGTILQCTIYNDAFSLVVLKTDYVQL